MSALGKMTIESIENVLRFSNYEIYRFLYLDVTYLCKLQICETFAFSFFLVAVQSSQ